jgi:tRNA threonylcarbamoyladenosine biosynthesis protein TsaE
LNFFHATKLPIKKTYHYQYQPAQLILLMEITYTLDQLEQTAEAFWKIAGDTSVIAFHGNMGSGKTTFIHALCNERQVKDIVGSPTFSIINEYFFIDNGTEKKIFHIDLYRLRDEQEAVQAGIEDCLNSDHFCLIEWPEKIPSLLPENTLHIFIETIDAATRKLRIGDN